MKNAILGSKTKKKNFTRCVNVGKRKQLLGKGWGMAVDRCRWDHSGVMEMFCILFWVVVTLRIQLTNFVR